MFKKSLIALAAIVVVFVAVVAMQPSEFRIARTATISAPAPAVFAQVNDFHNWEKWSPWEKLDPAMKKNYEGAAAGTGAIYSWVGNNEVGEGRMTITESRPHDLIGIKLEFLKPFAATNTTEFTFKTEGDQTAVTWSMFGKNNFMSKAFGLFMNMDKMVGGDFEKGLAQMKAVAEAAPTNELTITRVFDAPRELVWKAWTNPERVKRCLPCQSPRQARGGDPKTTLHLFARSISAKAASISIACGHQRARTIGARVSIAKSLNRHGLSLPIALLMRKATWFPRRTTA